MTTNIFPAVGWELEKELWRASKQYGFWRGALTIMDRFNLRREEGKEREQTYARWAETERTLLRCMEETNECSHIVLGFGKHISAAVFFDSPWKRRLESCSDCVRVAADVWSMSETSWDYRHKWLSFFDRNRDEVRKTWMTTKELRCLGRLPKPFELYRGYNKPQGKMGLSWTRDKNVAARIPLHPSRGIESTPCVITAIADPQDVIAYLTDRQEEEIIINPRNINFLKEEPAQEPLPQAPERHKIELKHSGRHK
jgi:hypothetical protein